MSLLPVGIGNAGGEYTIDDSLRFRSSASAYLSRTPASVGNRQTWTWSGWIKRSDDASTDNIFGAYVGANDFCGHRLRASGDNGRLEVFHYSSGYDYRIETTQIFRDYSSWYHIIVSVDTTQSTSTDRIKIYVNGSQVTALSTTTYPSLNFNTDINNTNIHYLASIAGGYFDGYMTEVNFIDGQALDATDFGEFDGTTGVWKPKEYTGTYGTNGFYLPMTATTQAELQNTVLYTGNGSTQSISGVGFSPDLVWIKKRSGAENHGLFDTVRGAGNFLVSNDTASEYARGNSVTSYDADGFSLGNYSNTNVSGGTNVAWCWDAGDNQTSTGISSVLYTGTGAALKVAGFGFSPDLVIAKARSAGSPLLYDSVRGAGYLLQPNYDGAESYDLTRVSSFDSDGFSYGSFTGGTNVSGTSYVAWGWDAGDGDPVTNTQGSQNSTVKANDATGFSIITYTGTGANATYGHGLSTAPELLIIKSRSGSGTSYQWMVGSDPQGWSNDMVWNSAGANGSSSRFQSTAPTSTVFSVSGDSNVNGSGQTYVAYAFDSISGVSKIDSYSGTGSAGNAITGLGFKPGFLMIKRLDATAEWIIVDSTRSPFNPANDILGIDGLAESSYGTTNRNIDFDSDGFTIQSTASGGTTALNASGGSYLYIAFKGSYSDYVSPLNDTGTIDSRVKANPDKGFSIVSFTAPSGTSNFSVGHGLSATPSMVIVKTRDSGSAPWYTWHSSFSNLTDDYMRLNATNAKQTQSSGWGAGMTSSVIGLRAGYTTVATEDHIAYCWHSVAGYSDFGSYTGNGSATGPVVTTGFRPAFVMIKRSDSTGNWTMLDNTRSVTDNEIDDYLWANLSNAESANTTADIEFTDTGFQIKNTTSDQNASTGTYIYMAFADTRDSQFNFDASGNKNNWTPNNINSNASSETTYDLMNDVPTLTDEDNANYATANPLMLRGVGIDVTQGNLYVNRNSAGWGSIAATIGVSSGKWYWEFLCDSASPYILGVSDKGDPANYVGYYATDYSYYYDGQKYNNASGTSYGNSYGNGDLIGFALDMDNGKIWFAKNGVWQASGDPAAGTNEAFSGITGTQFPEFGLNTSGCDGYINFGQQPFKYTPPTGFKKLNTYNLPDSTIEDGSEYFDTVLFSANNSTQDITGLEFAPDFVWLKSRSNAYSHELFDKLRGVNEILYSNSTTAETTTANSLTSFNSDGFSLGASSNANFGSGSSVGWNWKANGSGSSIAAGSIDGTNPTIASTTSANTTSGFSILTYTGSGGASDTLAHGLGVAPEFVIVFDRDSATFRSVYHIGVDATSPANYLMRLNTTDARLGSSVYWNNTKPTSSVVTIGTSSAINDTHDYLMYCFAEVEGFSAFGSYTGNGSTDGPFIYTGFSPSWLLIKRSDAGANWLLYDNKRLGYNTNGYYLLPDGTWVEGTGADNRFDLLSNGFKARDSNQSLNVSGGTYIYAAFAQNPFKNSLAR